MRLEIVREEAPSKQSDCPLLFIHGAFHTAWCWSEHFLPYFAKHGYTSIALSLRGHGLSDGYENLHQFSLLDYIEDVSFVISKLKKFPILIGHSMGGAIIQKYLEIRDFKCRAAVLISSPPPRSAFISSLLNASTHPLAYWKFMKYYMTDSPEVPLDIFSSRQNCQSEGKLYASGFQKESRRVMQDFQRFCIEAPTSIPMLVLGAGKDSLGGTRTHYQIAKFYKADVRIIPDMSHGMMLDPNWKLVADLILKWIQQYT